jgi:NADH-quinone oxidoreductase subunit I
MIIVKRKITLWDRLYLPPIIKGMMVTFKHIFKKKFTVQYPEELRERRGRYRGAIRLNKDEQGRIKCVACELCASACPSNCITIVPSPAPPDWEDRERFPQSFEINILRCIFCGFCEEACPVEAIELTGINNLASYDRDEMIWDKNKLLEVYDITIDKPVKEHSYPT